jgi:repressor LexA
MDNEFGNFIKKLRGKESLRDVSDRCDLSHTHIADLEKGINRQKHQLNHRLRLYEVWLKLTTIHITN